MARSILRPAVFAALAVMIAAVPSAAADRPRSPTQDLKTISDMAADDSAHSIRQEYRRDLARNVYTPGQNPPWAGGPAACATPRNQYLQSFGQFMARHTQREPTDRFAPPQLRTIETMNRRLRQDITRTGERLPEPGRAVFLQGNERLLDNPTSWDMALRQRAEWTLVLQAVNEQLAQAANGSIDFGANYAAGLWTRMACDFADQNRIFLRSYAASGARPDSPRSQKALQLLQARAGRP
jgi:hypothetical protein